MDNVTPTPALVSGTKGLALPSSSILHCLLFPWASASQSVKRDRGPPPPLAATGPTLGSTRTSCRTWEEQNHVQKSPRGPVQDPTQGRGRRREGKMKPQPAAGHPPYPEPLAKPCQGWQPPPSPAWWTRGLAPAYPEPKGLWQGQVGLRGKGLQDRKGPGPH